MNRRDLLKGLGAITGAAVAAALGIAPKRLSDSEMTEAARRGRDVVFCMLVNQPLLVMQGFEDMILYGSEVVDSDVYTYAYDRALVGPARLTRKLVRAIMEPVAAAEFERIHGYKPMTVRKS